MQTSFYAENLPPPSPPCFLILSRLRRVCITFCCTSKPILGGGKLMNLETEHDIKSRTQIHMRNTNLIGVHKVLDQGHHVQTIFVCQCLRHSTEVAGVYSARIKVCPRRDRVRLCSVKVHESRAVFVRFNLFQTNQETGEWERGFSVYREWFARRLTWVEVLG